MRARSRRLRRLRRAWGPLYPYMIGRVSLQWIKDNMVLMYWPVHRLRVDPRWPRARPTAVQVLRLRRS